MLLGAVEGLRRAAWRPTRPGLTRPESAPVRPRPPTSPRCPAGPAAPASAPRWRWRQRRAASYENARPPHGAPALNLAGPRARLGAKGSGRPRGAAAHPGTGSPGSRSSGTWTAASWRPPQPPVSSHINRGGGGSCAAIGGRARAQRHPGAGRGGRARLPRSRPAARNRRGPAPKHTPTRPRDAAGGSRQPRPPRGRGPFPQTHGVCVGKCFTFKGKRGDAGMPWKSHD